MGSHEEDQAEEIEALTSIFEEGKEFHRVSATEFRLKLVPHPHGDEENHVGFTLHITYTAEYPEGAPDWEVEEVKGLPDEKVKELKGKIEETIEASLGMVMIYSVAEACQDYLKENNVKELSMHEQMMQRLKQDDEDEEEGDEEEGEEGAGGNEEEEWKGLQEKQLVPEAERITAESFMAWKAKFDEEMIAQGVIKRGEQTAKSGKQFFLEAREAEKAAAGEAKDKPADGQGAEGVRVYNAALFGEVDEEDDDLDDLSDGEEEG